MSVPNQTGTGGTVARSGSAIVINLENLGKDEMVNVLKAIHGTLSSISDKQEKAASEQKIELEKVHRKVGHVLKINTALKHANEVQQKIMETAMLPLNATVAGLHAHMSAYLMPAVGSIMGVVAAYMPYLAPIAGTLMAIHYTIKAVTAMKKMYDEYKKLIPWLRKNLGGIAGNLQKYLMLMFSWFKGGLSKLIGNTVTATIAGLGLRSAGVARAGGIATEVGTAETRAAAGFGIIGKAAATGGYLLSALALGGAVVEYMIGLDNVIKGLGNQAKTASEGVAEMYNSMGQFLEKAKAMPPIIRELAVGVGMIGVGFTGLIDAFDKNIYPALKKLSDKVADWFGLKPMTEAELRSYALRPGYESYLYAYGLKQKVDVDVNVNVTAKEDWMNAYIESFTKTNEG